MEIISNPLNNSIFIPVIVRIILLFIGGFVLVILWNIKSPKSTFKSEVWIRYKSWLFMAPLFLLSVFSGGIISLLFIIFLAITALGEFKKLSLLRKDYYYLSIVFAIVSMGIAAFFPALVYSLPIIYFMVITTLAIFENHPQNALTNVAYGLFANMWINFSLAHLILLRLMVSGDVILLTVGLSVALSDIGAFVFGKLFKKIGFFDKYMIAPKISPNKTYVGIIGHVIGVLLGIWLMKFSIPISWTVLLPMGVLAGFSDVVGGFTASMVKRTFAVKDYGTLIPGHGGILDRIDSLLRVGVVSYYMILLFVF